MDDLVFIQFQASQKEKQLLSLIAKRNGRASVSATLRRLIHDEAEREEIDVSNDSRKLQPA